MSAYEFASKLFGLDNMPVTLISKPYKAFAKATVKLCLMFSFLVFVSFNLVMALLFFAVYVLVFALSVIFINFCVKFGYKRAVLIAVFAVLYFLCYLASSSLRNLLADSLGGL